jgi:hypothetical protein
VHLWVRGIDILVFVCYGCGCICVLGVSVYLCVRGIDVFVC